MVKIPKLIAAASVMLVCALPAFADPIDFGAGAAAGHTFTAPSETALEVSGFFRVDGWLFDVFMAPTEGETQVGGLAFGRAFPLKPVDAYLSIGLANRFAAGVDDAGGSVSAGFLIPAGLVYDRTWLRVGLRWVAWRDRTHSLGYQVGYVTGWSER